MILIYTQYMKNSICIKYLWKETLETDNINYSGEVSQVEK